MSSYNSKIDFYRHLHVQVGRWEESAPGSHAKCTKKHEQRELEQCLKGRLRECKRNRSLPLEYRREVKYFFRAMKSNMFDKKVISKLKQRREKAISMRDVTDKFVSLSESDRHHLVTKFEMEHIPELRRCLQTWTNTLMSMHDSSPVKISERNPTIDTDNSFNDTTWLRAMYKTIFKALHNIDGRVPWKADGNGVDPNNTHTTANERKTIPTKETLITELRSLCSQVCLTERPFLEEFQLLHKFLETGTLDKMKIQKIVKLRKLAVEITDLLLKMRGEDCREVLSIIDPNRYNHLIAGMSELEKHLRAVDTATTTNSESASSSEQRSGDVLEVDSELETGPLISSEHPSSPSLEESIALDSFQSLECSDGGAELEQMEQSQSSLQGQDITFDEDEFSESERGFDTDMFDNQTILQQRFRLPLKLSEPIVEEPLQNIIGHYVNDDDEDLTGFSPEILESELPVNFNLSSNQKFIEKLETFITTSLSNNRGHDDNILGCSVSETDEPDGISRNLTIREDSFTEQSTPITDTSHQDMTETDFHNVLELLALSDPVIKTANAAQLRQLRERIADLNRMIEQRRQELKPE